MSRETVARPTIVVPADVERDGGEAFLAGLAAMLSPTAGEIALDCSRLRSVNSSQINVLWNIRGRCEAAGVPVRLTYVGRGVKPPLAFESRLEASVEGVSRVMGAFRDFLLGLGLPEMMVFDLGTVFYEVATNIREHGGLGDRSTSSFTAVLENGKMTLRFVDSGRPFDPGHDAHLFNAREAIKRRQHRCIGLVMVRRLMDTISYERLGNKNVVIMERWVRQPRERAQ
jgi:anti-sigma regulatory factor (Ser/Thr protein kinase)